jgi:hypothetical protein
MLYWSVVGMERGVLGGSSYWIGVFCCTYIYPSCLSVPVHGELHWRTELSVKMEDSEVRLTPRDV